ncbi:HesB/IscA family protein [Alicyclobacillus fodiniaquatilis]|jgi:Fe-S cluster assembly iron-binding protein IscA|uniref:HesB/IscA family protein n=1 Tax=Alicyclobacillus fodiniaquatilis TaxID=1661150 RepID=A0ABW4JFX8_9BACL
MQCKITPSAKKQILSILREQTDKNLKLRVYVTHAHGDHAHYGMSLDYQKPDDLINATTPGIEVLLESNHEFLNGIVIDYDATQDGFSITNPQKGHHHHH